LTVAIEAAIEEEDYVKQKVLDPVSSNPNPAPKHHVEQKVSRYLTDYLG